MDLSLNIVVCKDQPEEVEGHYTTSQTEDNSCGFVCQHTAATCLLIGLQHLFHSACCSGFCEV